MLTAALLLFGIVLLALTLASRAVGRLPLTPAVIYLATGWAAGWLMGAPTLDQLAEHAAYATFVTEAAVLISLLAVGLRLRVPPRLSAWSVALLMAGPGMVVTIALTTAAAMWLLALPWPAALLLAAILAPTDPVLASEVQIHSERDRDAVRLSLTAEGGLNDGTALPAVMLALGLMGLHGLGDHGRDWWLYDLAWAIGGGSLLGIATGLALGYALRARLASGDPVARDELLYVGTVGLAFALARASSTSTFVVVFTLGVAMMWPFHEALLSAARQALADRLGAFGERVERLIEAASVLSMGVILHTVPPSWSSLAFACLLVVAARPISVFAVVRRGMMTPQQRRLVAWFGIRGIGTLFYLAFALAHGVSGDVARELVGATLTAVAVSILLHGVSATPLMTAYQRRRRASQPRDGVAEDLGARRTPR
jgi:NhaP-type Na+/H+ or K+/H+ antiporter